jgi:site-specific DNA recombinase
LETGTSKLYSRKCYGYRHDDEGNLVIDEPEAKIVRSIFDLYLSGYSIVGIVKELERRGVKSPTGKARWSKRTIETMLSNEKYIGNVLIGKIYCKEYPNNKRLPNRGEREKYFSTGGHPAIIAVEQFECVMAEKTNRRNVQTDEYGTMTRRVYHYSMKTVDIIDE